MVKSHEPYLGEIMLFFGMRKIRRLYYIGNVIYIRSCETLGIFSILYMNIYIDLVRGSSAREKRVIRPTSAII